MPSVGRVFSVAISILLLCVLLLLLRLCVHYTDYGYKITEKQFTWGSVGARLIGEEKSYPLVSIRKSPYELFVWVSSTTLMEGTVSISELKLMDRKTKSVFYGGINRDSDYFILPVSCGCTLHQIRALTYRASPLPKYLYRLHIA